MRLNVKDVDKCIGCQRCAKNCPVNCIDGELRKPHNIDQSKCIKCGMCFEVCPVKGKAVSKVPGQYKGDKE